MIVHIVTNRGMMERTSSYAENIKVFADYQQARKQYDEWCGSDPMARTFSLAFSKDYKVGVKSIYKCGEIDVELFTTEVIDNEADAIKAELKKLKLKVVCFLDEVKDLGDNCGCCNSYNASDLGLYKELEETCAK